MNKWQDTTTQNHLQYSKHYVFSKCIRGNDTSVDFTRIAVEELKREILKTIGELLDGETVFLITQQTKATEGMSPWGEKASFLEHHINIQASEPLPGDNDVTSLIRRAALNIHPRGWDIVPRLDIYEPSAQKPAGEPEGPPSACPNPSRGATREGEASIV